MMDDLMYRYVWQPEWDQPLERIGSLADVLRSQQIHYWCNSGRFIVHVVAQVMLNLVPESVPKLLNAAMFVLLTAMTARFTARSAALRPVTAALAFAMLFLLLRGFRTSFIWLMGSFNYLWVMVANMAFLLAFRSADSSRMGWRCLPLLLPLSFLAGWTHEALSVPVALALLHWLFRHRRGLPGHPGTYCALAYMLGAAMIMLSPALWHRADENGISLINRMVLGAANMAMNVRISWLLMLTLAILWHGGRGQLARCLRANRYVLTAWAAAPPRRSSSRSP